MTWHVSNLKSGAFPTNTRHTTLLRLLLPHTLLSESLGHFSVITKKFLRDMNPPTLRVLVGLQSDG
ncbi:hypothetical protein PIB30_062198 [Stylosanthes scabra]|uniref:Uncharacterized protein n=1 Tax=Stylosanthes scabra TaxID=79078 RepID=A0ABU6VMS3_9FABA|nr:hypothetical protein [Stylosanthes scabra]